jgi:hypothetical protein
MGHQRPATPSLEVQMPKSLRRKRGLAIAGTVALVPAVFLLGSAASGSTTAHTAHTLRFLEKPGTFTFVDIPPQQGPDELPAAGDGFVFTSRVFRGGERVGTLHARCTVTTDSTDPANLPLLCDGALVLPHGTITGTTLTRSGSERTVIAITGGTGRFTGAEGTMVETPAGGENQHLVVRLTH